MHVVVVRSVLPALFLSACAAAPVVELEAAPVDVALIERSLLRLSQMVTDFADELQELDLNPFIVTDSDKGSFVVDARVMLQER